MHYTPTSMNYARWLVLSKFADFLSEKGENIKAAQYRKSADEAFKDFKNETKNK